MVHQGRARTGDEGRQSGGAAAQNSPAGYLQLRPDCKQQLS